VGVGRLNRARSCALSAHDTGGSAGLLLMDAVCQAGPPAQARRGDLQSTAVAARVTTRMRYAGQTRLTITSPQAKQTSIQATLTRVAGEFSAEFRLPVARRQ